MQKVISHLSTYRGSPRLWFERLVIFREPDPEQLIRTIPFNPGLNLVWAREPAPGSAKGTRAAGHGVGKTSLCLLLRFCLGDTSKAIAELREELLADFPRGGVAAVLHLDGKAYTICRYFNLYKDGVALAGSDLDRLWQGDGEQTYKEFEQQLSDSMMASVLPRNIPETGQVIEWRHVLAWLTRDQGARFKSFFAWREGEGTGLSRSRQDPPIVMRAVLGLLEQGESDLMNRLATLEHELDAAQQETARLRQEPALIRRRMESELRAWAGQSDDLPIRTDDLFKNSVERELRDAERRATEKQAALDVKHEAVQKEIVNLRVEMAPVERQYERAKMAYELADAARRKDEAAYLAMAEKLVNLNNLSGQCEHGNVAFRECRYVLDERRRLQATDLKDGRDRKALERSMAEAATKASAALTNMNELDSVLQGLRKDVELRERRGRAIRMERETVAIGLERGKRLLSELERWERMAGSAEAQAAIERSVEKCAQLERDIDSTNAQLDSLRLHRTTREKELADIADLLTREIFSDEAFGTFEPRDENRPFHLSMRGGEAYRVLEVLLGDLACLLNSGAQNNAFPGFVIHDCPREADMSSGLYEDFLLMVARIQQEGYGENVPFQYIVTTTTPPPVFPDERYLCLTLDPSIDDGLLFKQRLMGVS